MGLQLFSKRTWAEDSFNETNVELILRDTKRTAMKILNKVSGIKNPTSPEDNKNKRAITCICGNEGFKSKESGESFFYCIECGCLWVATYNYKGILSAGWRIPRLFKKQIKEIHKR